MKRIIVLLCLASVLCGLCACGHDIADISHTKEAKNHIDENGNPIQVKEKDAIVIELVDDEHYHIAGSVSTRNQDEIVLHFQVENKTGMEMWVRSDQLIYYVVVNGIEDKEIWRTSFNTCVSTDTETMKDEAEFEIRIGTDFFKKHNLGSDAIQRIEFDYHPLPYDEKHGGWKTMSVDEGDEHENRYGRHIVFELPMDGLAENIDVSSLCVVTCPDYEPFAYLDSDSNIIGFDIDLANRLASDLGYSNVVFCDSGTFDAIMGTLDAAGNEYENVIAIDAIGITAERIQDHCSSTPYYTFAYDGGLDEYGIFSFNNEAGYSLIERIDKQIYEYKINGYLEELAQKWHPENAFK